MLSGTICWQVLQFSYSALYISVWIVLALSLSTRSCLELSHAAPKALWGTGTSFFWLKNWRVAFIFVTENPVPFPSLSERDESVKGKLSHTSHLSSVAWFAIHWDPGSKSEECFSRYVSCYVTHKILFPDISINHKLLTTWVNIFNLSICCTLTTVRVIQESLMCSQTSMNFAV